MMSTCCCVHRQLATGERFGISGPCKGVARLKEPKVSETKPKKTHQMSKNKIINTEELKKAIKRAAKEAAAKNSPNPYDSLFAPGVKPRIIRLNTPEAEERKKQHEQWLRENATPAPSIHSVMPCTRVNEDGVPELNFASESQIAERRKAEDRPVHTFKAVVDQRRGRWAVKRGFETKWFVSSDDVVKYCRWLSKGERSVLEFYKAPKGWVDEWQGDTFGDFIHSESW
jgi:hypothetical protein